METLPSSLLTRCTQDTAAATAELCFPVTLLTECLLLTDRLLFDGVNPAVGL